MSMTPASTVRRVIDLDLGEALVLVVNGKRLVLRFRRIGDKVKVMVEAPGLTVTREGGGG